MRIIVSGGRTYRDSGRVRSTLLGLRRKYGINLTIVEGGASGADQLAGQIADELGLYHETHHANWKQHGKAAGPIRNARMLETGAQLLVTFPGGAGTLDMATRARKAGIEVQEIT